MSDNEKLKEELSKLPAMDPMTKLLVDNVLKKHGVTKDKMKKLSDEEKEMFLKMLNDVKEKAQALADNQNKNRTITEKTNLRTEKQNTRREQLIQQLKQKRQNKKDQ
ncbi:spore coat protein [Bacillus subtilis]|uniref:Spore coat protein n=1 Tax=Bacillus stercoris TaxID=2054641 RepID=A0ABU0V7Q5_9BACI|nr:MULTISPECIES: spore coat protein [Bacillus]ARB36568.1 spore coat protein [Bacillus subtilis]MCR1991434.1 spore coat protein [Bacillus subtilis]MDQ1852971.1 spore coat protein [Bacillus stercoris]QCU14475.1 spore coat protein [Bacillus subtilis]QHJ93991.1 Spore coat protein W [Bacillus subtilis]